MIVLLDNYDSFTFNLYQQLLRLTAKEVQVIRNDKISVDQLKELSPAALLISPGPGNPSQAGISLQCVKELAPTTPILGVCLGHQAIAQVFGAQILISGEPRHGKTSLIYHQSQDLFDKLPSPFCAMRYHSLIVDEASLPETLEVTARSQDGFVMAIKHKLFPCYGVQFHPESFLTEHGDALLSNFLKEI